jgi:hypothetical protein
MKYPHLQTIHLNKSASHRHFDKTEQASQFNEQPAKPRQMGLSGSQHNDIQHYDTHYNGTQHIDIEHNCTQHKGLSFDTEHNKC